MSNDLISRSMVMDYLREQQANVIIEKNKNGFVSADVCDGMQCAVGAFINFIVQAPTAYDVDKVVERMEGKIRKDLGSPKAIWYNIGLEDAMMIAKTGFERCEKPESEG